MEWLSQKFIGLTAYLIDQSHTAGTCLGKTLRLCAHRP